MSEPTLNEARKRRHMAKGELNYHLELFGDDLARQKGYKAHTGMDAIYFFLVDKYRWTPSVVKSMSFDDLHFLLSEEMNGWVSPPER